jgi:hypothetical protein
MGRQAARGRPIRNEGLGPSEKDRTIISVCGKRKNLKKGRKGPEGMGRTEAGLRPLDF